MNWLREPSIWELTKSASWPNAPPHKRPPTTAIPISERSSGRAFETCLLFWRSRAARDGFWTFCEPAGSTLEHVRSESAAARHERDQDQSGEHTTHDVTVPWFSLRLPNKIWVENMKSKC